MNALLIDSGVDTIADLLGLLPPVIAAAIDHDTLLEADFASSLRMLATIKNPGWHRHVRTYRIDWAPLLMWARTEFITTNSVRVRVEIAASLGGYSDSQALLMYGARALDETNYTALMDAMRIARQGVSR
jgi:hypothetical protein